MGGGRGEAGGKMEVFGVAGARGGVYDTFDSS